MQKAEKRQAKFVGQKAEKRQAKFVSSDKLMTQKTAKFDTKNGQLIN